MSRGEEAAVVLAAGKGTRMKQDLPKVMSLIGGRPLIHYVVEATLAAGVRDVIVIHGYMGELVTGALEHYPVRLARQVEQLGTGHAVRMAADLLSGEIGPVLVLAGDIPLVRAATMRRLLDHHAAQDATVTVLTTDMPDATGYGRIIRDPSGRVRAIVEERDATAEEKTVREINSSIYAFDRAFLLGSLDRIRAENAQKEYYLTDLVYLAVQEGLRVEAIKVPDPREVSGVNTVDQLQELEDAAREMGLFGAGAGGQS